MKVALESGAYEAKGLIAEAQRCVNLFPERNPKDAPFPFTHYLTPGLVLRGTAPNNKPTRCAYTATDGSQYLVAGSAVYTVSAAWGFTKLGDLTTSTGIVKMVDNGFTIIVVDGSLTGFQITLGTQAFAQITDANFQGGSHVGMVDGFFVLNVPGSNEWYASNDNQASFNALGFATKAGFPDPLAGLAVIHREPWLFGNARTTEVWFNAGQAQFAFQILPGVFIQYGCAAPYSITTYDQGVYWIGKNENGGPVVLEGKDYRANIISTRAIEQKISSYSTVADAVGFSYLQDGHPFYQLSFPTADQTWVFDIGERLWHQRAWMDTNGALHRHRGQCFAVLNGLPCVGDWQNGNLYSLDTGIYDDNGVSIQRVRSWPHLDDELRRTEYNQFICDMLAGEQMQATPQDTQNVSLRWSDDRGRSFGNALQQTLGPAGKYNAIAMWNRLGVARDRVFEVSWSFPAKTALNGAYIEDGRGES